MVAFVSAGAGFLIAVLWFDLMFDVQVLSHREGDLPEPTLASIAAYYARVTTAAQPMSRLIALVMLATLAAIVAQIAADDVARWVGWVSLALALFAIVTAGTRTLPRAVRLGARTDGIAVQSTLARAICRQHLCLLAAFSAVLVVQLSAA